MIPETQQKALAVLSQLCELSDAKSDDIRLGQLVAWLGDLGMHEFGRGLAYLEDDELLVVMHRHREMLLRRLPESQQKLFGTKPPFASIPGGQTLPSTAPATELGT